MDFWMPFANLCALATIVVCLVFMLMRYADPHNPHFDGPARKYVYLFRVCVAAVACVSFIRAVETLHAMQDRGEAPAVSQVFLDATFALLCLNVLMFHAAVLRKRVR